MMNTKNYIKEEQKKIVLKYLEIAKAPLLEWGSEPICSPDDEKVINFHESNKEFYAIKNEVINKMEFYTKDGELGFRSTDIRDCVEINNWIMVTTEGAAYHLVIVDNEFSKKEYIKEETNFIDHLIEVKKESNFFYIKDTEELTKYLFNKYPYTSYGSYRSAYQIGLRNNDITIKQFEDAEEFYGRLWNYVGD